MEHLLKLSSLTPDEIIHILDVADEYKRLHKAGTDPKDLQGKAVALMFGKHSTRTRTSLEVGIYQMGGLGTYLSAADMQIARGEPIQDTARVLGRYYDAIVYRTFKHTRGAGPRCRNPWQTCGRAAAIGHAGSCSCKFRR